MRLVGSFEMRHRKYIGAHAVSIVLFGHDLAPRQGRTGRYFNQVEKTRNRPPDLVRNPCDPIVNRRAVR